MILFANLKEADNSLELVDRFKRGDETAFDSLFAQHKDGVYSLVVRTVGVDAAEDVCQEVFVQVFRSLGCFRGESSLRTWIYRITMNVCSNHLRQKSRQPLTSPVECLDQVADTTEPVLDITSRWTSSEIEQAIILLPELERAVIELHYVQGMSYREMAEVLDCPSGTIKARVHSAIVRLKRKLSHLVEEVEE